MGRGAAGKDCSGVGELMGGDPWQGLEVGDGCRVQSSRQGL